MLRKYRIVKQGDTETYLVQQRFLRFFWFTKFGAICSITSVQEAREYIKDFEAADSFSAGVKKKNTVIE